MAGSGQDATTGSDRQAGASDKRLGAIMTGVPIHPANDAMPMPMPSPDRRAPRRPRVH